MNDRNPAYDGPEGVFAGYGEYDEPKKSDKNEIALYGLSTDGGVTWIVDKYSPLRSMTMEAVETTNYYMAHSPLKWVRIASLPDALNAEKNEKAVKVLRDGVSEYHVAEAIENAEVYRENKRRGGLNRPTELQLLALVDLLAAALEQTTGA